MKEAKYKLAISNLAWDRDEDQRVLTLLRKHDIWCIEIACSKIWDNPIETSASEIKKYRDYWEKNGIKIVATTSLLFGHPELTIFENESTRKKTLDYLNKMADVTSELGAGVAMFGSPKNRIKGYLSDSEATKIAADFFGEIAEYCKKYNIYFVIEPNPPIYGGDYILTMQEGVDLAKKVNHPNFGLNLDASTIASSGAEYENDVKIAVPYAYHAHISEPYLKPIPNGETEHEAFAAALKQNGYDKWLSIEMPLKDDVDHLMQIEKTLEFVESVY